MNISSVSNAPVYSAPVSQASSEDQVEGNTPDGDNDQDDVSPTQSSAASGNTPLTTGTVGRTLNVLA